MKNVWKKLVCLACSAVFLTGLTACGDGQQASGPDYDDPTRDPFGRYETTVKITGVMEYQSHNDSRVPPNITPDNQAFVQLMKERLNLEFSYIWKVPPTQYSEKLSLSMLANELPDVFKVTASDYSKLKNAGMLKDLSTAYEYASEDVRTYLYRDPSIIESLTDEDGSIYAVPQYSDNRRGISVMYIRQDWLDDLGLQIPTTPDELYTVLRQFKDKKGAECGLAMSNAVSGSYFSIDRYMNMFGASPYSWLKGEDGKLYPGEVSEDSRTALTWLNKLYREELLMKDVAAATVDMVQQNVLGDKCGVVIGPWWQFEYPLGTAIGDGDEWVAAQIPLAEGKSAVTDRQQVEFYYVVNKNCRNPEALFKMINMYIALDGTPEAEPENGYVWSWCPTQFYDPYDINEQYVKINEQLAVDPKAEGDAPVSWTAHMKKLWKAYPEYLIWQDDPFATKYQENMFANIMTRVNKDGAWAQIVNLYDTQKRVKFDEFYGVTTPAMSSKGAIMSQEVEEYYLKVIMGKEDIATSWDDFVSAWEKIGGTEVTEEVNAWYEANGYHGD